MIGVLVRVVASRGGWQDDRRRMFWQFSLPGGRRCTQGGRRCTTGQQGRWRQGHSCFSISQAMMMMPVGRSIGGGDSGCLDRTRVGQGHTMLGIPHSVRRLLIALRRCLGRERHTMLDVSHSAGRRRRRLGWKDLCRRRRRGWERHPLFGIPQATVMRAVRRSNDPRGGRHKRQRGSSSTLGSQIGRHVTNHRRMRGTARFGKVHRNGGQQRLFGREAGRRSHHQ